ncbi:hypothetical protein SprV_0301357700 [Sparganum proliferum]
MPATAPTPHSSLLTGSDSGCGVGTGRESEVDDSAHFPHYKQSDVLEAITLERLLSMTNFCYRLLPHCAYTILPLTSLISAPHDRQSVPLLLSDPSTAAAAATKAATVGGGGGGASTPLRVNMLNDLIQQMVSLKHTPSSSSSVSLVGAGNMTATDDGPNNTDVIGSSSTTKSQPTLSAGEIKQLELTITSALTRAQRLLDNDAARKALGGTYIYQTDWLSSKPKSDMPFAHVHVDLMGLLSTSRGCNYLLTAVDRFARWSFATPTPNVAANTVPRAFLQHWISHCAVPSTITID